MTLTDCPSGACRVNLGAQVGDDVIFYQRVLSRWWAMRQKQGPAMADGNRSLFQGPLMGGIVLIAPMLWRWP
jgi:hypothetical protein